MRLAARVDVNQKDIVAALRAAGAYVWIIGLPVDLLVGFGSKTCLVEIKRDGKAKYTKLQTEFMANWTGGPVSRVNDVEGALRVLAIMKAA